MLLLPLLKDAQKILIAVSGTYVWNNVVIKRGCSIYKSIVCDDVKMHENVVLEKGCILCDKVLN